MPKRKREAAVAQPSQVEPQAPLDRAWSAYGAQDLPLARRLLEELSDQSPQDVEAAYLSGLVCRAQGDSARARRAFQTVVENHNRIEDRTRARMLRRLAVGHLNQIERGAWDLEPETWERT